MIIKTKYLLLLSALIVFEVWSQSDVGYLNGVYIYGPASGKCTVHSSLNDSSRIDKTVHSSTKEVKPYSDPAYKRHYDIRPSIRLNNVKLGFALSKLPNKTINLIPLVDLGVQYNTGLNQLNHRNGMGFLLEARPVKKSYVRIGGLFNLSNAESLNPGNINLTDIGTSQKLWVMPITRLAYTPNEVFCFQAGYDRNFIGSGRRSLF